MVQFVRGPADCRKSHFSAFEIEERIRNIDGVLDVSGEDGREVEFAQYMVVTVDDQYRGKPHEEEIRTEVQRLAGNNVEYQWAKREDDS